MQNSKRVLLLLLVLSMAMTLLVGCGGNNNNVVADTGSSEETPTVVEDENVGPKVLRLAGMPAETLNPHTNSTTEASQLIDYMVGTPLDVIVNETRDGIEFYPNHLSRLPETEDNVVWTLTFRDGLAFSDGTPIDAYTYEYSWKMLLHPSLANYGSMVLYDSLPIVNAREYFNGDEDVSWEDVGINVLDANTIEITLTTGLPESDVFMALVVNNLAPVHQELYEATMDDEWTATEYGSSLSNIISSGPYTLVEWTRDQFRAFDKNEDSPMAHIYVPDRIESRVVTESATRLQLFESGQIDSASVSGNDYDRYQGDPRLVYNERNTVWGYYVNGASEVNPVLQDVNFRKAMYYGINRDLTAKGVFRTFESAPYFISTVCVVGDMEDPVKYRETPEAQAITPVGIGYEPEKALEYFEKAYEANGNQKINVEIVYFESQDVMRQMVEVTKEQLEELFGADRFEISLRAMPANAAYEYYYEGNHQLGIGARSQSPFNPWRAMRVWTSDFPQKAENFYNAEFDELYERTVTGDLLFKPQERLEALVEMERLLMDEVPFIPVFQNNNAILYAERIHLVTDGVFIPVVDFGLLQSDIVD